MIAKNQQIKYLFLLLTFLLGATPTHAKTEALRFEPLANVIHLSDDAAALTGYSKLGTIEEVYVVENGITKLEDVAIYKNADDVLAWRGLAQAESDFVEYIKNGFKINASTLDDAFKHINDVTLNGMGKPKFSSNKLIGCHNEVNFKAQSVSNGGRIEIINEIPTNVNGVKKIEYKTLKLDNQGNPIAGQYVSNGSIHTKTVFDPSIYPESTMKSLGYNAFKNAMDNNTFNIIDPLTNNIIPRSFEGVSNGRTIQGHYKVVNGEKIIWTWWIVN